MRTTSGAKYDDACHVDRVAAGSDTKVVSELFLSQMCKLGQLAPYIGDQTLRVLAWVLQSFGPVLAD